MSDTLPHSIWYKLRYTPLRDLMRGEITARMDLRRRLEEAAVPPEVRDVVHRVVKGTRLWRLEQLEVAQELLAHFSDGIASGASPELLIKQFGDEHQAATLIRRAKQRSRALPWHVVRVMGWSSAALALVYLGLALSFFWRTPSPRVDYVANINREIERTPVEDRAWPLYRRVLLSLPEAAQRQSFATPDAGKKESSRLLEIVRTHPQELEWLRQGTAKPTFGFLIGASGSAFDAELWPNRKPPQVDPVRGEDLAAAAIPPLITLRNLTMLLRADAVLARQQRDAKRLIRNIDSLLGLSRQLGKDGPLLVGLVSLGVYETALEQIEQTLNEDPTLLQPEEWAAITRRVTAEKTAADLFTVDMERIWFHDMLQRSFTDDGSGNGRLTPDGIRYFDTRPSARSSVVKSLTGDAVAALLAPTREQLSKDYNQLADRASANLKMPIREANWEDVQAAMDASQQSFLGAMNPMQLWNFTPAFWRLQEGAERRLGQRDGVVIGIALEAYRKEHGKYPDDLNALVPEYLAEMPADRITGDALRYRLENNKPVIYSVGGDHDDDGGRTPPRTWESAAKWVFSSDDPIPDGDWVLYPSLR